MPLLRYSHYMLEQYNSHQCSNNILNINTHTVPCLLIHCASVLSRIFLFGRPRLRLSFARPIVAYNLCSFGPTTYCLLSSPFVLCVFHFCLRVCNIIFISFHGQVCPIYIHPKWRLYVKAVHTLTSLDVLGYPTYHICASIVGQVKTVHSHITTFQVAINRWDVK
jgi:hypothetical protein